MENSKKLLKNRPVDSKRTSFTNQIKLFLEAVFSSQKLTKPHLLVAYSGGLDSTVLLHLLAKMRDDLSFTLSAMHVHHGLSENADSWVLLCKKKCAEYDVLLKVFPVNIDQKSGLGIEAAARNARYQALSSEEADFICLAQHQDDQAETLLLQLARGAGVKGLAGMAMFDVERNLLRPFLNNSRLNLEDYAKKNQLQWIEDESNTDDRYDRNYLRHAVLPILRKRYPNASQTLSRSAAHLAEASQLLNDLAMIDADIVMDKSQQPLSVNIALLKTLSDVRQVNLIRWWLAYNQIRMPSTQLLKQLLQQIFHTKKEAQVKVKVADDIHVMCYQDVAYLVHVPKASAPINILWHGEGVIVLPDLSRLLFTQKMGEGFAFKRGGSDIKLRIKKREGGERFKPDLARPNRTLKYIMQASQMPPWQRAQLPLIFMDETLVIIPNVGIDASFKAKKHEMGLSVSWQTN
jgi:tRNA(Ile)-lysidine synthase